MRSSFAWVLLAFGLCLVSIILGYMMPIPFRNVSGFFTSILHNQDIFASQ